MAYGSCVMGVRQQGGHVHDEDQEGARRRWLPALLATVVAVVAVASIMATTASGKSSASDPIKVAIMTDCKGAFGAFYDDDIGGAQAAFVAVRRRRSRRTRTSRPPA